MSAAAYFASVAFTALAAGIASMIAGKDGAGTACRMACSLALIYVVLSPLCKHGLHDIELEMPDVSAVHEASDHASEQMKKLSESVISAHVADYAEKRTAERGIKIDVKLATFADDNGEILTECARIEYTDEASYARRDEVSAVLSDECGIPPEKQEHKYEKQ